VLIIAQASAYFNRLKKKISCCSEKISIHWNIARFGNESKMQIPLCSGPHPIIFSITDTFAIPIDPWKNAWVLQESSFCDSIKKTEKNDRYRSIVVQGS